MPVLPTNEKGAVLTAVFDKSDPARMKQELEAAHHQLAAVQRKLGFEAFLAVTEESGTKVTVTIIPCSANAPGATSSANLGKAFGGLQDSFRGTGKIKDPAADEKAVAGYEGKSSGSFLEDPDFGG